MVDEVFWAEKYRQNIGRMIGLCYRYVGDRQLSEDLAHDAFLKAIEKSNTYQGIGHFNAWLMRITVNTVLLYLREQKKIATVDNPDVDIIDEEEISEKDDKNKLNAVLNADFSEEEIIAAIQQLPERQKVVFNLYVFENYSHKQIAETLKITLTTSKVTLLRARKELQNLLYKKTKIKILPIMITLLFIANDGKAIDKLFRKKIGKINFVPQKPLSMSTINWVNMPNKNVSIWLEGNWSKIAAGVGIAAASSAITYLLVFPTVPPQRYIPPQISTIVSDTVSRKATPETERTPQSVSRKYQNAVVSNPIDTDFSLNSDENNSHDTVVVKKIKKIQKKVIIKNTLP